MTLACFKPPIKQFLNSWCVYLFYILCSVVYYCVNNQRAVDLLPVNRNSSQVSYCYVPEKQRLVSRLHTFFTIKCVFYRRD